MIRLLSTAVPAVVAALSTLLLTACGPSEPAGATAPDGSKLTAVRFQTDWYPQAEHGGFYQAKASGLFAEAGLNVTLLAGGPGPTSSQKLVAGAADISMGRSDDLIQQISQGLPFVIVGVFMQHDPQALLLHASNPIESFEELDGKTIMAVPGSNWINYLKNRFQIDFQIIPTNFGIAQFMSDPGFIQQCFITNEPYYVAQNGANPKTLLLSATGFDPYRVIYTTRRYLRDHPDTVRKFVEASVQGWRDYLVGDASAANQLILTANSQMTADFIAYSIESMRDNLLISGDPAAGERYGLLEPARLQAQIDAMMEIGLLEQAVTPAAVADFDMASTLPVEH